MEKKGGVKPQATTPKPKITPPSQSPKNGSANISTAERR